MLIAKNWFIWCIKSMFNFQRFIKPGVCRCWQCVFCVCFLSSTVPLVGMAVKAAVSTPDCNHFVSLPGNKRQISALDD